MEVLGELDGMNQRRVALMLVVQPASNFGDLIRGELSSEVAGHPRWHAFEFAVAWVNHSGAESIKGPAQKFLAAGKRIRATVGVDFGSTSFEGLGSLLDLEDNGTDITTHVFHDENSACTFHPKLFLFSNADRARLLVGSNNLTGAGLATNVEASLAITDALDTDAIRTARQTLTAWRDEGETRARRVTRELLEQLREEGYVLTEAELRTRRNSQAASERSRGSPLFGRSLTQPRRREVVRETPARAQPANSGSDEVLLMRVRKRRNGNQVQVSIKVLESDFMSGATQVLLNDGSSRRIGFNAARGKKNTQRFEAPGLQNMTNPVARLRWINPGNAASQADRVLRFELFDADEGGIGAEILETLEAGISTPPVTNLNRLSREGTVLSKSDRESAQWYRLHLL